jgi:hypothetical protein
LEQNSKFRVVARAVKQHAATGEPVYRPSFRILDHVGEEIDAGEGQHDFADITSAYNEAFALGRERLRELSVETYQ